VGRNKVAVIDPGPDAEEHVRALAHSVDSAETVTILLTHRHSDHAGGAPALARTLEAPIKAFPGYQPADPDGLSIEMLGEGDLVPTDEGALRALSAPGHSREHLIFHWADARALFAGDLLLGEGRTTWVGEYLGCVEDYLRSLDKVESLDLACIYPGHGPPITAPAETVAIFRRHRFRRLEQVRKAHGRNPGATPEELAAAIYGGALPEGLARAASSGVRAALFHLGLAGGGD